MATSTGKKPWLPPRWFIRSAWWVHRRLYGIGGARFLRRPTERHTGMLCLRTTGRRTGVERAVILAYVQDGPRLVTLAMNGWGQPPPAWWLNLTATPDALAQTVDGPLRVRSHEAQGEERRRLWQLLAANEDGWGSGLDDYAALRSRETPIVVLDPTP
jgi:deazaflavin-dependent oxidoreductase (nitroreductase family)